MAPNPKVYPYFCLPQKIEALLESVELQSRHITMPGLPKNSKKLKASHASSYSLHLDTAKKLRQFKEKYQITIFIILELIVFVALYYGNIIIALLICLGIIIILQGKGIATLAAHIPNINKSQHRTNSSQKIARALKKQRLVELPKADFLGAIFQKYAEQPETQRQYLTFLDQNPHIRKFISSLEECLETPTLALAPANFQAIKDYLPENLRIIESTSFIHVNIYTYLNIAIIIDIPYTIDGHDDNFFRDRQEYAENLKFQIENLEPENDNQLKNDFFESLIIGYEFIALIFCEEQIASQPGACCKYITQLIARITGNSETLLKCTVKPTDNIQKINGWNPGDFSLLQEQGYRESYLSEHFL